MADLQSHLVDSYGRRISYLRLSITDRCNLRCFYCMPQANFNWMPHDHMLRYEEILQIVRVLSRLGIKKVRFTGGEPLVRRDAVNLIAQVARLPGIEKVCLTTNGVFLGKYAESLLDAGLRHINISLDTMKADRFRQITGFDHLEQVMTAIRTCISLGFHPVKINFVMIKGKNDDELIDFALLTKKWPVDVRFIEFMPIGKESQWDTDYFLSSDVARRIISKGLGEQLEPIPHSMDSGPAELYGLKGGIGRIGFISPLTHRFCSSCNRIRIRADGTLRLCLFSDAEIGLREMIRNGVDDAFLESFFKDVITQKPARYSGDNTRVPRCKKKMSAIGG